MTQRPATRLFSGIQPSGEIHIGNYAGAIRNWVKLQYDYDAVYCIVDYHAITQPFEPATMPGLVRDAAVALLAAGIDPRHSIVFVQSHVPEHTELAWVLSSLTSLGALERMTQFKEKSGREARGALNAGLLGYPVLQTADILLYKAEAVPVGEDQLQHLELSREVARRFNHQYGELFPEPQPVVTATPRIMGVDGKTKMSKSRGNTLPLLETAEVLWERLRPAVTDENRKRRSDPGNPEICNIFTMHKAFSSPEQIDSVDTECRRAGIGCVDCKRILFENIEAEVAPFRERAHDLAARPDDVEATLEDGAGRARSLAKPTMDQVRRALGLREAVVSSPVARP